MKTLAGIEINSSNTVGQGRFVRVIAGKPAEKVLEERYGRKGLCLKVLRYEGALWEGVDLVEATRLQNLGAIHGVAPRVYDIVRLPDGHLAQVTDFIEQAGEPRPAAIRALIDFLQEAGAGTAKRIGPNGATKWDIVTSVKNWGGDLFLDWGGLYFAELEKYLLGLGQRAAVDITRARRGQPVKRTYQTVSEFQLSGSREMGHRIKMMGLDRLDFKGKLVLDLGCNLGLFCHYAAKRGARRVLGIDLPVIADPAREITNWLGFWNVDFCGRELPVELDSIFDIVLALSICNHVGGYGQWMAQACRPGGLFILEGHGGDEPERYAPAMKRDFSKVKLAGYTTDSMRRPVIVGRK